MSPALFRLFLWSIVGVVGLCCIVFPNLNVGGHHFWAPLPNNVESLLGLGWISVCIVRFRNYLNFMHSCVVWSFFVFFWSVWSSFTMMESLMDPWMTPMVTCTMLHCFTKWSLHRFFLAWGLVHFGNHAYQTPFIVWSHCLWFVLI